MSKRRLSYTIGIGGAFLSPSPTRNYSRLVRGRLGNGPSLKGAKAETVRGCGR
jgi:hypothetical protein